MPRLKVTLHETNRRAGRIPTLHFAIQTTLKSVRAHKQISRAETNEYFSTRPRGSQIGAYASPQSQIISETTLQERLAELEARFPENTAIEAPDNWGGWRIVPT